MLARNQASCESSQPNSHDLVISRRTLLSATAVIGALHLIGARTTGNTLTLAYADDAGQSHFSVYVLNREEIPLLALDVSSENKVPVAGMEIRISSRINDNYVTAVTDDAGAAVANVRALTELADASDEESYAGWVEISGAKEGYRSFTEISRLVQTAMAPDDEGVVPNVVQVPTQPTGATPYFSCMCIDGVDVQYLPQTVGLISSDDSTHQLDLVLENADSLSGRDRTWEFTLYADGEPLASASSRRDGSTASARLTVPCLDGAHGIAEGSTLSITFAPSDSPYAGTFTLPLAFQQRRLAVANGYVDDQALWLGNSNTQAKDYYNPPEGNLFAWWVRTNDTFSTGLPGVPIQLFSDRLGNFGVTATLATCTFYTTTDNEFVKVSPKDRWKKFSDLSGSGWLDKYCKQLDESAENWRTASTGPGGKAKMLGASKLTKSLNVALSFEIQAVGKVSDMNIEPWKWHADIGGLVKFAVNVGFSQQLCIAGIPIYWTFDFTASALLKLLLGMKFEDAFRNIELGHETFFTDAWPAAIVFVLTAEAGLGVGFGFVGIASLGVRGFANFTFIFNMDGDTRTDPTHTFPHLTITVQANIEMIVQFVLFKKSFVITKMLPHALYDNWEASTNGDVALGTGAMPDARFGAAAALSAGADIGMEMVTEDSLADAVEFRGEVTSLGTTPGLTFIRTPLLTRVTNADIDNPYVGALGQNGDALAADDDGGFNSAQGGYNPLRGVKPTNQTQLWTDAFSAPRCRTVVVGGVTYLLRLAIVEVEIPTDNENLTVVQGSNGCLFAQADAQNDLPAISLDATGNLAYPAYEGTLPLATLEDFGDAGLLAAGANAQELVTRLTVDDTELTPVNATTITRSRLVISALRDDTWTEPQVIDFATPTVSRSALRINVWDVDFDVIAAESGQMYITLCSIVRPADSTSFEEQFKSQFLSVLRYDPQTQTVHEPRTDVQGYANDGICWHPRICVHQATIAGTTFDEITLLYYYRHDVAAATLRHISWLIRPELGEWTKSSNTTLVDIPSEFANTHLTEGTFDARAASLNGIDQELIALAWSCPAVNEGDASGLAAHDAMSIMWAVELYSAESLYGDAQELEGVDHVTWGAVSVSSWTMHASWLYSIASEDAETGSERLMRRLKMTAEQMPGTSGTIRFEEEWPVGNLRTALQFFSSPDGTRLFAARAMEGTVPGLPDDAVASVAAGAQLMGTYGRYNSPAAAFEGGQTGEQIVQNYQLLCAYYDEEHDSYYDFFPLAELDFCPDTLLPITSLAPNRYDFVAGTITDADRNLLDVYHVAIPYVIGLQFEGVRALSLFAMPGEKCRCIVEVSNTGNIPLSGFDVVFDQAKDGSAMDCVTLDDLAAAVQTGEDHIRAEYDSDGMPTGKLVETADACDASGLLWPGKTRSYAVSFTVAASAASGTLDLHTSVENPIISTSCLQELQDTLSANSMKQCVDPRARVLSATVGGNGYAESGLTAANYEVDDVTTQGSSSSATPKTGDSLALIVAGAAAAIAAAATAKKRADKE